MATHTNHPPIPEAGLADDCPRCYEHSQHPFESMDNRNLKDLVDRYTAEIKARSYNEADAMADVGRVFYALDRLERIGVTHDPDGCSADLCPCWTRGNDTARETVGEWHRPMGY